MNERRRMPMKKGSFIRNLSIMLFAQLILLTVLFVVLVANMRDTATAEMETAADNMLSIYSVNLENRIERADNILKNLTLSEETSLELIRSDSESDRYYAKKTIYTAMHSALVQDDGLYPLGELSDFNGFFQLGTDCKATDDFPKGSSVYPGPLFRKHRPKQYCRRVLCQPGISG